MIKIPPYLIKGDIIGITCPAGYMATEKAQTCIDTLHEWSYNVMVGKTLGSASNNYFSGTDEERLNELQAMLDDDSIKAILCGRGGYGVGRIIEKLDFKLFEKKPKWIIGFSDITVLHAHIYSNYKIATLHAPMAAAFNDGAFNNEFIQSLKNAIEGKKAKYECAIHDFNKRGEAIGELLYKIDRMLYQLKRSGKLNKLAGLIIGGFTDMSDTERFFGKTVYEIVYDIVKEYDYPVCFNFPVSHQKENYALKIGVGYKLKVGKNKVTVEE